MKTIYLIIIILGLISCDFNSKNIKTKTIKNDSIIKVKSPNSSLNNIDTTTIPIRLQDDRVSKIEIRKKNILKNGDPYDFIVLDITYINEKDYTSILPYALLMSEKYNHKDAYESFYINFIKIVNNGVYKDEFYFNLDIETQRFLKHYLKKGSELGQSKCKSTLISLEKIAQKRHVEF